MKKLLLLLGLFSTGLSYAQTEDPKEEWREIKPYSENVRIFGSLEREKIPFGILSDYSIETTNLRVYDGKNEGNITGNGTESVAIYSSDTILEET